MNLIIIKAKVNNKLQKVAFCEVNKGKTDCHWFSPFHQFKFEDENLEVTQHTKVEKLPLLKTIKDVKDLIKHNPL